MKAMKVPDAMNCDYGKKAEQKHKPCAAISLIDGCRNVAHSGLTPELGRPAPAMMSFAGTAKRVRLE